MFKLVRTDGESESTTLLPGIHEFGRGVFLDCKDRRVAHHHGRLTVGEDNKIALTALHKNPCFVKVKNSPGLIVMSIGMTKEIKEGDEIGLLPDTHWYRLTKNETFQKSDSTREKTEAVEKNVDSSSLLGNNVEKIQPSDEDTALQHTETSHSPSAQCEHSSSRAEKATLSTETVHNDEETESKKLKRNLQKEFSSAPTRGSVEADPVKLPIPTNHGELLEDDGVPEAGATVDEADETCGTAQRGSEGRNHGAKRRAMPARCRASLRRTKAKGESKDVAGRSAGTMKRHQVGKPSDERVHQTLFPDASPVVRKRFARASPKKREAVEEKGLAESPTRPIRTPLIKRPKLQQMASSSSPASTVRCVTLSPLRDPKKVATPPEAQQQSCAPPTSLSVMSSLENDGGIYPQFFVEKEQASATSAPVNLPTAGDSPYNDDAGTSDPKASDPDSLLAIPSTSSGVSKVELKVHRKDQDHQSVLLEFVGLSDDDLPEDDGDLHLSEDASRALYGSDVESDHIETHVSANEQRSHRQIQPHTEDDDFSELGPELLDLTNEMTGFEDGAIESVDPEALSTFTWSSDFQSFEAKRETFRGKAGPTNLCTDPLKCFLHFWDEGIVSKIVMETNRYAEQQIRQAKLTKGSRLHRWAATSVNEMYLLFSIFILQSVFPLTLEREYWHSCSEYTRVAFSRIMSYDRFILLKRFLHFRDNDEVVAKNHDDSKLAKLQPVIDHLSDKFSSSYIPFQEIAIDDSLTLWKGKLSWLQYIQTKAARIGIKSYELCESSTGYMWKFLIYRGKSTVRASPEVFAPHETEGATTLTVLKLMEGIMGDGYTLFMDNFYNCPSLARYLKSKGTDCVGTLRTNCKHVPRVICDAKKMDMKNGEMIAVHSGDVTVFSWRDENKVSMISTYHGNTFGEKEGVEKSKPAAVLDYNASMGGVDLKDQRLSCFLLERIRNLKWYKKMFKRLMNVSVLNAYIIYKSSMETVHASPKILSHRKFRYAIADDLIEKFKTLPQPSVVSLERVTSKITRPVVENNHFVLLHDSEEGKRRKRKQCLLCKKTTVHYCSVCKCTLCVPDCFIEFHTSRVQKNKSRL